MDLMTHHLFPKSFSKIADPLFKEILLVPSRTISMAQKKRILKSQEDFKINQLKQLKNQKYALRRKLYHKEGGELEDLPIDLYRGNVTPDEIKGHNYLVKKALSLNNASRDEILKSRIEFATLKFGKNQYDSGSPPVQASVFCEKVVSMISHIKEHPKDIASFIKLEKLLFRRKQALKYLKKTDFNNYAEIVKYYNLNDIDEPMCKDNFRCKRFIQP